MHVCGINCLVENRNLYRSSRGSSTSSIFRVVLSSAKSTKLSIGCTITGTEPSPAAVGSHFDNNAGIPTVLATANLDARTITIRDVWYGNIIKKGRESSIYFGCNMALHSQLITPPGMATLASPVMMRNAFKGKWRMSVCPSFLKSQPAPDIVQNLILRSYLAKAKCP